MSRKSSGKNPSPSCRICTAFPGSRLDCVRPTSDGMSDWSSPSLRTRRRVFGSRVIDQSVIARSTRARIPPMKATSGMRTYVVPREDQIPNRSLSSCCFFMVIDSWMGELRQDGAVVGWAVVEDARAAHDPARVGEDVIEPLLENAVGGCLRIAGEAHAVL